MYEVTVVLAAGSPLFSICFILLYFRCSENKIDVARSIYFAPHLFLFISAFGTSAME